MSNLSIRDTISGSVSIGEGSTKGIIKGSISIGKGEQGVKGDKGDNNVCIGLSPTNEAEIWFDTTDGDNTKEVATKEYIDSEIAKIDSSNFATKTELSNKADKEHIHNQYLTEHQDISGKVDKVNGKSLISDSEIERLSTLKNYDDSNIRSQLNDIENEIDELRDGNIEIDLTNYVTKSELSAKADKTELHSHSNKSVLDGISSAKVTEWNNKSTFSGNYNDLTNKPTIPTAYDDTTIKASINTKANTTDLTSHTGNAIVHVTSAERTSWNAKSTLTLGTTSSTAYRGDYGNTAYTHSQSAHAPSNAQKNSDITKAEIEAKLNGDIRSHTHSQYLTTHQDLSQYAKKSDLPIIVQEIGDSENLIMSQKAVTDFVRNTFGDNNNSGYERVDSINEMIDTSKQYILNSTNTVWVYKESGEGEPVELYEPSKITLNQRYSGTPGTPTSANGFFITDYIPIVNNGSPKIMITDDTGGNSTSNTPSLQKCTPIDENLKSLAALYCYGYNNQNNYWYATKSDKTLTLDLSKLADGSAFEDVDKIKYVRIDVRASSSSITNSASSLIASIKDLNNKGKVYEWVDTGMTEDNYDYAYLRELINEANTSLDNLENEIENLENEIENLKQSDGDGLVPSYVISESEIVAEKVLGVRNSDSFVIACASDLHTTGSDISAIGVTHMGMAMNEINKITQLDLVAIFGDIIVNRFDDNHKKGFNHVKKSIDEVRKAVPYIQMQGNHDELPTDTTEQGRQKYYAYIGANNVGVTTDYSNKFRNYGYKDFENYKMRVIYLNSADVSDGEITTDVNISYEQFNWFINTALDFSTKDNEWSFIVCTHHPLNWVSACMPNLLTILDSYKGKTSGSINISGKSIGYNFTTTKATLIAHFHGHLHNFRSETLGTNKVLSITIPNACFGRNNEYGTSPSYSEELRIRYGDVDENGVQRKFNKTSDSADDTSFNVIVIDKLNSKIHCFNYGAGIDRIIDFNGTTD